MTVHHTRGFLAWRKHTGWIVEKKGTTRFAVFSQQIQFHQNTYKARLRAAFKIEGKVWFGNLHRNSEVTYIETTTQIDNTHFIRMCFGSRFESEDLRKFSGPVIS